MLKSEKLAYAVGVILGVVIFILCFAEKSHATQVTTPTVWNSGDTVTNVKLNNNQNAITNVVNGNLDNTNTASGYKFFTTASTLPAAGNQGTVTFQTSDNTLNLDNGATWQAAVAPSGTLATGKIPYYNGGWSLLTPGAQYLSLVSNGTTSLPSYQTLTIAGGGTGQTTAQAAIDALLPSQASANGKYLTSNGAASSWGTPPDVNTSNVVYSYGDGGNGRFSINATSTPPAAAVTNGYEMWTVAGDSTYRTAKTTRFKKVAGISTLTLYAALVSRNGAGTTQARITVNSGGLVSGNATTSAGAGVVSWASTTVDVSSLSNGTVYDLTVDIYSDGTAGIGATVGGIIFGS